MSSKGCKHCGVPLGTSSCHDGHGNSFCSADCAEYHRTGILPRTMIVEGHGRMVYSIVDGTCFYRKNGVMCVSTDFNEIPQKSIRPMTSKEMAMLPRGTAFVLKGSISFYNPAIRHEVGRPIQTTINGINIESFDGYILPDDPEGTIRKFEVEDDL